MPPPTPEQVIADFERANGCEVQWYFAPERRGYVLSVRDRCGCVRDRNISETVFLSLHGSREEIDRQRASIVTQTLRMLRCEDHGHNRATDTTRERLRRVRMEGATSWSGETEERWNQDVARALAGLRSFRPRFDEPLTPRASIKVEHVRLMPGDVLMSGRTVIALERRLCELEEENERFRDQFTFRREYQQRPTARRQERPLATTAPIGRALDAVSAGEFAVLAVDSISPGQVAGVAQAIDRMNAQIAGSLGIPPEMLGQPMTREQATAALAAEPDDAEKRYALIELDLEPRPIIRDVATEDSTVKRYEQLEPYNPEENPC